MSSTDFHIDGSAETFTRLNIDVFSDTVANPAYKIQWALYLRAQLVLQKAKPEDPYGYHGLAGVHGLPLITWPEGKVIPGQGYYCAHGRPAFLTWHRAYMLLYEKRVIQEAVKLARLAPANLRADHEAEAYKIRLPFWDWGHSSALPAALRNKEAKIIIPEIHLTNLTTIRNPLYSYVNNAVPPLNVQTTRNDTTLMDKLMAEAKLRSQIYHDLTKKQGYAPFSNTGFGSRADSIEQPHNFVHNTVGGATGEMADDAVAAYDPVFWLHHASVDRYYALWQVLHPDKLYQENKSTHDTVDNILAPFSRSDPHGSWTSRMIQRTEGKKIPNTYDYGVEYPETLKSYTEAERLAAVTAAVLKLYGPQLLTVDNGLVPISLKHGLDDFPEFLKDYTTTTIRYEWRVALSVRKDLINGNFGIFFFLGDSGDDTALWGTRAIDAGSFMTFKGPIASCPNCQETKEEWIYGSIYLTDHIYEVLHTQVRDGYQDIAPVLAETGRADPKVLAAWLTKNLTWKIRKHDRTEFVLTEPDLNKIRVEVESFLQAYTPLPAAGQPIIVDQLFGVTFDHTTHISITEGKVAIGGATAILEESEE